VLTLTGAATRGIGEQQHVRLVGLLVLAAHRAAGQAGQAGGVQETSSRLGSDHARGGGACLSVKAVISLICGWVSMPVVFEASCMAGRGPETGLGRRLAVPVVLEHLARPCGFGDRAPWPHFGEVGGEVIDRGAVDGVQVGDVEV
jgi:hypothetical protein